MLEKRKEIVEKLREILLFADEANKDIILTADEDTELTTGLGLTSIKMLYMVISIEETFAIRFDDVSFNDFHTLKDIVDYIAGKTD